ncbi:MAG: hypothetical protein JW863_13290 [Chitinispirillaceae bacterium]|nr:hypothetical protein [Chitinispirillaceae bacterium]
MSLEAIITAVFILQGVAVVLCKILRDSRRVIAVPVVSSLITSAGAVALLRHLLAEGPSLIFGGTLLIDELSLLHILLVSFVFLCSSVYATGYFREPIASGVLSRSYVQRYAILWLTFQLLLLLVLLSNNIGLMWVAIEATTLVSAFLILSDSDDLSVEAMWKYLLICSVGIVFAFMGTILTVTAARKIGGIDSVYLLSRLAQHPDLIDPKIMLFAFILIVVGFGTKAGLAPMHTWLPDAHSQAPTLVSAVFSSVMLNVALFCILRYMPVTVAALGNTHHVHSILMLFGFLSLLFAAVFIPIQLDMKRFLAYCSVEHIGIIAIGLATGGLGTFAALLHSVNHSVAKMLSFFSAGHIGDRYGTRDMSVIRGAVERVPVWGGAFFVAVLILLGIAPGAVFFSELLILKEAFFTGKIVVVVLFMFLTLAIFIGALRNVMHASFGSTAAPPPRGNAVRPLEVILVVVLLLLAITPGLWLPDTVSGFLRKAAAVVEQGVRL